MLNKCWIGPLYRLWKMGYWDSNAAYCYSTHHMYTLGVLIKPTDRHWLHNSSVKIRTIFQARDLWKLARSCTQLRLLCPLNLRNVLGTVSLSWFQTSSRVMKSTVTCTSDLKIFFFKFWHCHFSHGDKPVVLLFFQNHCLFRNRGCHIVDNNNLGVLLLSKEKWKEETPTANPR